MNKLNGAANAVPPIRVVLNLLRATHYLIVRKKYK
jgi:hypothetical protein